jgi:hypothetical protein
MADIDEVKFTMSLTDLLSPQIEKAEKKVVGFEGNLSSLGSTVLKVGDALGLKDPFENMGEFFRQGVEMARSLNEAQSQLESTIDNVGERAGFTAKQLVNMAGDFANKLPFTATQMVNLENELSRFGNMTPETFKKAIQSSADLAVATKKDSSEVAKTLGAVLEYPGENLKKLKEYGITFTASQKQMMQHLENTGQVAKAQQMVFEALAQKGYNGVAAAAANDDPLFRYNKIMEQIQGTLGNVGLSIVNSLAPALTTLAGDLRDGITWISEHKRLMGMLGSIAIGVAGAYAVYSGTLKVTAGIQFLYNSYMAVSTLVQNIATVGIGNMTAAQWGLNEAMDANPIGIIIVALAAVAAGVYYAWNHFQTFRGILMGVWEFMKAMFNWMFITPVKILVGLGEMIAGAITFNPKLIARGFEDAKGAFYQGAMDLGTSFQKGFDEGSKDATTVAKPEKPGDQKKQGGKANPKTDNSGGGGGGVGTIKGKSGGAKNDKVVTYNVHIQQLGCGLKIKAEMPADRVHDYIVDALSEAVGDSQVYDNN